MTVTYITFPKNFQPLLSDIENVINKNLANLGGVRWGTDNVTKTLALELDDKNFSRLLKSNMTFGMLIEKWVDKGATITPSASFVPNENALKPMDDVTEIIDKREAGRQIARDRHMAAKEAHGRSGLRVQQTIDRINQFGETAPTIAKWGLAAVVAGGTAFGGYKLSKALQGIETRRDTITRVIEGDPMNESLNTRITKDGGNTPPEADLELDSKAGNEKAAAGKKR